MNVESPFFESGQSNLNSDQTILCVGSPLPLAISRWPSVRFPNKREVPISDRCEPGPLFTRLSTDCPAQDFGAEPSHPAYIDRSGGRRPWMPCDKVYIKNEFYLQKSISSGKMPAAISLAEQQKYKNVESPFLIWTIFLKF